ncbi:MAG: ADP-ribosylglycohydrolase family protein [Sebaldella sp.]|nr:ADP-ribosylglycohydrolase family protein [Sebaldella sp.]
MVSYEKKKGAVYGFLIGDAVGVPYEFYPSEKLKRLEVIDMIPPKKFNRSHKEVKPGTWSDDGAQMLCVLASVLECRNFNINNLAKKLLAWYEKGYMAVNQKVFDIGVQTEKSLLEYRKTKNPLTSGLVVRNGRGNGSLMRVLPLALFGEYDDDEKLVEDAHNQSLITHGDIIPQICCAFYCLWIREIVTINDIKKAFENTSDLLKKIYEENKDYKEYLYYLEERLRPRDYNIKGKGTGYVLDTLRSVRDILFDQDNYKDVIINSVLLGNDTDTVAAIAGGIAGLYYGYDSIPEDWLILLKGKNIVEKLLSSSIQE